MRKRPDAPLDLRCVYPLVDLARAAGVTRFLLRRLLVKNGVEMLRSGRSILVPLTEIEKKIPALWESLKALESERRAPN